MEGDGLRTKSNMTTGRPIATKCPACKRGKWGKEPVVRGVRRTPNVTQRDARRRVRRGTHRVTLTSMSCLDCGHSWWTTLERLLETKE
jgi:hypothetical protein